MTGLLHFYRVQRINSQIKPRRRTNVTGPRIKSFIFLEFFGSRYLSHELSFAWTVFMIFSSSHHFHKKINSQFPKYLQISWYKFSIMLRWLQWLINACHSGRMKFCVTRTSFEFRFLSHCKACYKMNLSNLYKV